MKVSVTVCDKCGDRSREAQRYQVKQGTRVVSRDFCAEHGEALEEVLKEVAVRPRKTRKPRSMGVTSLEEIEASKKA